MSMYWRICTTVQHHVFNMVPVPDQQYLPYQQQQHLLWYLIVYVWNMNY